MRSNGKRGEILVGGGRGGSSDGGRVTLCIVCIWEVAGEGVL